MPSMRRAGSGGLVYSTDGGTMCPACRRPLAECRCARTRQPSDTAAGDGVARVGRQTHGRSGKTVTLVRGLPLDAAALAALGQQLRAACGSGGTVKDGVIEIQGDHRERVLRWLGDQGYRAKAAGG